MADADVNPLIFNKILLGKPFLISIARELTAENGLDAARVVTAKPLALEGVGGEGVPAQLKLVPLQ